MGFSPQRPKQKTTIDYLTVGAALAICVALLLWALLG